MKIFTTNGTERVLSDHAFLISETDEKGMIVFANDDFCQLTDYPLSELIGRPHNVVRHPDMPSSIFQSLWNTIKEGRVWTGFVKNKNRSGTEYHWAYATVYPVMREGRRYYISCRRKPTVEELEELAEYHDSINLFY